jgi:hypothetical protein
VFDLAGLFGRSESTLRAIILMVFDLNPFKPVTFFQQQKISNQKMPPTSKVLNRKKWLILGSFRMYPFKLHSNGVLAICPKNKPFFC